MLSANSIYSLVSHNHNFTFYSLVAPCSAQFSAVRVLLLFFFLSPSPSSSSSVSSFRIYIHFSSDITDNDDSDFQVLFCFWFVVHISDSHKFSQYLLSLSHFVYVLVSISYSHTPSISFYHYQSFTLDVLGQFLELATCGSKQNLKEMRKKTTTTKKMYIFKHYNFSPSLFIFLVSSKLSTEKPIDLSFC